MNTDVGEIYIWSCRAYVQERQTSILGWRVTLIAAIAEEKSQCYYI
jgi:hypothetical protein